MKTRFLVFSTFLLAGLTALMVYCWPQLPDQVPIHWAADGSVNGYGPRASLWLFGPGMLAALTWLFCQLPTMSPQRYGIAGFAATYYYLCGVALTLFAYVQALVLLAAMQRGWPMQLALPAGLNVMLILLGNPMGKVRRNFFMGIRTRWTLNNDVVWHATHRLAARLMVASGVLGLIALVLQLPFWLQSVLMLAWAPLAVLYSYRRYQQEQQRAAS